MNVQYSIFSDYGKKYTLRTKFVFVRDMPQKVDMFFFPVGQTPLYLKKLLRFIAMDMRHYYCRQAG
jgi:hypothetical protein